MKYTVDIYSNSKSPDAIWNLERVTVEADNPDSAKQLALLNCKTPKNREPFADWVVPELRDPSKECKVGVAEIETLLNLLKTVLPKDKYLDVLSSLERMDRDKVAPFMMFHEITAMMLTFFNYGN